MHTLEMVLEEAKSLTDGHARNNKIIMDSNKLKDTQYAF